MGLLGTLFKTGGDTIKGTLEGAGTLAKDIRTAITNEIPAERRAEIEAKALQMESEVKRAQAEVIIAEAKGDSWLQRNWRPIVMLGLFGLIIADCFGFFKFRLSNESWELLKIALGGYVIGQSAEVVADKWNKV